MNNLKRHLSEKVSALLRMLPLAVAVMLLGYCANVHSDKDVIVTQKDGRWTLVADQVPLGVLGRVLRSALDCRLYIDAGLSDETLSVHIQALPLRRALRRLFQDYNYILVMANGPGQQQRLREIYIYARSRAVIRHNRQTAPLVPPDNKAPERLPSDMRRALDSRAVTEPPAGVSQLVDIARKHRQRR